MSKEDIKLVLKPLIQECIKEAISDDGILEKLVKESIFESGVLSGLIKEVVEGLSHRVVVGESTENTQQVSEDEQFNFTKQQRIALQEEAVRSLEEKKRKLENTLGAQFEGIFENVNPISQPGNPSTGGDSKSPLSGYSANDAGVDITGIMALAGGNNWKNMI
jgi:hypothetical protein